MTPLYIKLKSLAETKNIYGGFIQQHSGNKYVLGNYNVPATVLQSWDS